MNYKEWKETAMSYSKYYPGVYLKGLIKTATSSIRIAGGIQDETDQKTSPKQVPVIAALKICAIMEIKTRSKATMRNFRKDRWQRRQVSNRTLRCLLGVCVVLLTD
jgi:hypothetical protein